MQKKISTRDLVFAAMIAALYTAMCLALAPISYGLIQVRVAEALTLLPVFSPVAVWGVTLGCGLSNLVGFFTGMNILGYMDIFFGTAATLAAALLSRKLRKVRLFGLPVLSALPPILINAVVIGAELAIVETTMDHFLPVFLINAVYIAVEQSIACIGMGLPLVWLLSKSGAAERCFGPTAVPATAANLPQE